MGTSADATATLHANEVAALSAGIAAGGSHADFFRTVEEIAARRIDAIVFSASTCDASAMELHRVFSSMPEVYPVGLRKSKRETSWGRQVLRERRVYVGEGPLEMAAAFDDQERMASLGIRSIINVPVVANDRCLGVLNFGRGIERVTPNDVTLACLLGVVSSAAFVGA